MDYVVSASELYQKAKEILNDGMEYVSITLSEPDEHPSVPLPASVHFDAFKKRTSCGWADYEEIDVVDPSEYTTE